MIFIHMIILPVIPAESRESTVTNSNESISVNNKYFHIQPGVNLIHFYYRIQWYNNQPQKTHLKLSRGSPRKKWTMDRQLNLKKFSLYIYIYYIGAR